MYRRKEAIPRDTTHILDADAFTSSEIGIYKDNLNDLFSFHNEFLTKKPIPKELYSFEPLLPLNRH